MLEKKRLQSKPGDGDRLLRLREVAEKLNLTLSAVQRMVFERRLQVVRVSPRAVRIKESYLKEFIESRTCEAQSLETRI